MPANRRRTSSVASRHERPCLGSSRRSPPRRVFRRWRRWWRLGQLNDIARPPSLQSRGARKAEIAEMPAYQQMGHQSENLLFEPDLSAYAGAILSPVNYTEDE